ncbi:hypothetical protein KG088_04680 [Halomonas sp. TRM85114]|uniref:GDSL-type esterase/lipase family protein n=1 Tax=Halomonas jincaotanensis TaxID=2810616 RepID=UPI001BD6CE22|nr:GDSL-type esterase/lipase family protein [Halomonas jincaotanensis]MBS9402917.1 hypothetical protein [Halomonas jincaotanensis]
MSRVIRLKEWGCNLSTFKRPSEKQIAVATSALEDKDYALNTDSNGFIINSLLVGRDQRKKHIVLLGDSFVESLFVDEDKRLNAIIERLVPDVNVLNGGYSGATSLHLINIIINKVIPFAPDYTVVFVPTNDQRIQSLENGYWNKDPKLSPLVPLGKKNELTDNYKNNARLKSVEKALKTIHFLLDSSHIPHCFVTTPHRHNVEENDEWLNKTRIQFNRYNAKVDQRKLVNLACRDFCKKYYIDLVDLESQACDSNFFYDDLHLTIGSSQVVGKILFEKLNSLGIF